MKYLNQTVLAAALAVAGISSAEPFKVIVPMSADDEGAMARLVNYDNGTTVDSVLVADGMAVFEGQIDEPVLGRVTYDGGRLPIFILESGTISLGKDGAFFGTMLNDQLRSMGQKMQQLGAKYQSAADDKEREAVYKAYGAALDSAMTANADNALGYFYFLQGDAPQADAAGLRALFERYPSFAAYERSKKMLANAERREATGPGAKFTDFEVEYNGEKSRLSDYVGRGHYTLVDFWASWCGPCIRQTVVLKDIYNKYKDKGLEVLGVAVWDEPDATLRAIEQHQLPWKSIIGARTIPTDLYGITGIPCIILFGPDGTIISRDKQDDALRADVDAAMAGK